ncbi:MAG: hypothetical protein QHH75_12010 [Bacillota bacterium]|nr:hypothetical protein [Bacillota bacterium]
MPLAHRFCQVYDNKTGKLLREEYLGTVEVPEDPWAKFAEILVGLSKKPESDDESFVKRLSL